MENSRKENSLSLLPTPPTSHTHSLKEKARRPHIQKAWWIQKSLGRLLILKRHVQSGRRAQNQGQTSTRPCMNGVSNLGPRRTLWKKLILVVGLGRREERCEGGKEHWLSIYCVPASLLGISHRLTHFSLKIKGGMLGMQTVQSTAWGNCITWEREPINWRHCRILPVSWLLQAQ